MLIFDGIKNIKIDPVLPDHELTQGVHGQTVSPDAYMLIIHRPGEVYWRKCRDLCVNTMYQHNVYSIPIPI